MGALAGSRSGRAADHRRHLRSPASRISPVRSPTIRATPALAEQPVSDAAVAGLNDDDLLQEVAQQSPRCRRSTPTIFAASTSTSRTHKSIVAANPNDEEARRSLMEAYQEKAMLFELAMDRSLP